MDNPDTLNTQYSKAKYRHRISKRSVTRTPQKHNVGPNARKGYIFPLSYKTPDMLLI